MKRYGLFVLVMLAGLGPIAGCKPGAPNATPQVGLPVIGPAPQWTLKTIEGATIGMAELKGKVVVIDFWATWCPPCVEEIPGYIALQKKYADKGLVIVGLSVDQGGIEAVKPFAKAKGVDYPLALADEKTVEAFGGIDGIPTTFLIDQSGNIRHIKTGMLPTADYEKLILALLK
jgi:peroxiredoxin